METDINKQLIIIRKSLKRVGESKEDIENIISIINNNYDRYKHYLFKRCQFMGIDNIGIIIGIDALYECMSSPEAGLDDIIFFVQLDRKKSGDISTFLGSQIIKIFN